MAKIDGTNGILQSYAYQNPTTGFSYTIPSGTQTVLLDPAGTLATGTVTLPATPVDGMVVTITSTQQITAITFSPNSGQSVVGAQTTLPATQAAEFMYRASNTTWYNLGVNAVAGKGPAFSAYANASLSVPNNVSTKAILNAKEYDTNSNFDSTTNYRFTPTIAGYYQASWGVLFPVAGGSAYFAAQLYKNGSIYRQANVSSTAGLYCVSSSALVFLNGSTDYIELYVSQVTGSTQSMAASPLTFLSGYLARSA